jgi:hypothetical protein
MPSILPDPAQPSLPNRTSARTLVIASAFLMVATLATSQTIGSPNTVTADPPIPHPKTTPCTVPLFSDVAFSDFTPKSYTYTPACAGPWSKVILIATFQINAGRQFDRTANLWLGGVNIYFGTTAEPSHDVSRTWRIQRDLTDYSALLTNPQAGEVDLGNLVNSTYTSVLHGSAFLQFYPPDAANPAPVTADLVLPMSSGPTGETVALNTTTDQLAATFTLPTTVERAYLDVLAQSQSNDEFWYACVPNDVAAELFSCGNTGFRESEVTIDGQPAGVAPVYPWIYTGGIDPYLWRPIPGVQTLNFVPYRVDLTPFAGTLSDGNPHTVALSVFNANRYFSATATLLIYEDHGSTQVTGAILKNTLTAQPSPKVTENLTIVQGLPRGFVTVTSGRRFTVKGYVNTSHGKVTTAVEQTINFSNRQYFKITPTVYIQNITQQTDIRSTTNTSDNTGTHQVAVRQQWPLTVDISQITNPDGSLNQTTTIEQTYQKALTNSDDGTTTFSSLVSNTVSPSDTLEFDSSFNVIGNTGQSSSQQYKASASTGSCYRRTLTAAGGVLTGVVKGCTGE